MNVTLFYARTLQERLNDMNRKLISYVDAYNKEETCPDDGQWVNLR